MIPSSTTPYHIHFLGIGGIAMANLACLSKRLGFKVSGSDKGEIYEPTRSLLLKNKISVRTYSGQLESVPDVVVVGATIRSENEEFQVCKLQGLRMISMPQALKMLAVGDSEQIVVAGTHGKTTSTAAIAHVLHQNLPGVGWFIGGLANNVSFPVHQPDGDRSFFVIEGDEYRTWCLDPQPKFLNFDPRILLCTNVEMDHANLYKGVEELVDRFAELLKSVPNTGLIVINMDSLHLTQALSRSRAGALTQTYGERGDWSLSGFKTTSRGIEFGVAYRGHTETTIRVDSLYGRHNAFNLLGSFAILRHTGIPNNDIKRSYRSFVGVKRRFEIKHWTDQLILVDDFAHHPTAVRETLRTARASFPGHRLVAFLQPVTFSSCLAVFQDDYLRALRTADVSLVARPTRTFENVSQLDVELLVERLRQQGTEARVAENPIEAAIETLASKQRTIFIGMSVSSLESLFGQLCSQF